MANTPPRKLKAPWTPQGNEGGFEIRDANGMKIAYVYARDDLVKLSQDLGYLTTDEARRVAANIGRLPEMIAYLNEKAGALVGCTEGSPEEAELIRVSRLLGEDHGE